MNVNAAFSAPIAFSRLSGAWRECGYCRHCVGCSAALPIRAELRALCGIRQALVPHGVDDIDRFQLLFDRDSEQPIATAIITGVRFLFPVTLG